DILPRAARSVARRTGSGGATPRKRAGPDPRAADPARNLPARRTLARGNPLTAQDRAPVGRGRAVTSPTPAKAQTRWRKWLKRALKFAGLTVPIVALSLCLVVWTGLADRSEEHTSELQSRGHLV